MAANTSLQKLMEQFIREKFELGHLSIEQMAFLQRYLIGNSISLDPPSFTSFLKRIGVSRPLISNLNNAQVGAFWEYLAQYHGLIIAAEAMRSLRDLWMWLEDNRLVPICSMPADLKTTGIKQRYRANLRIIRIK